MSNPTPEKYAAQSMKGLRTFLPSKSKDLRTAPLFAILPPDRLLNTREENAIIGLGAIGVTPESLANLTDDGIARLRRAGPGTKTREFILYLRGLAQQHLQETNPQDATPVMNEPEIRV